MSKAIQAISTKITTTLSRRAALFGASSAVAGAVVASAALQPAHGVVMEDVRPKLTDKQRAQLDLLETLNGHFCDLDEEYRAAREQCEAVRSDYPRKLVWDGDERNWRLVDVERDIDGYQVFPPNYRKGGKTYAKRSRQIFDRDHCLNVMEMYSKRSKYHKEAQAALAMVNAHLQRVEAEKIKTGYDDLKSRREQAGVELEGVCEKIMQIDDHSPGGLMLKAHALIIPFNISNGAGMGIGWRHGQTLAKDIILHAGISFPRAPGLPRVA